MSIKQPDPREALDALRAAQTQLRALADLPSADPFYASAAEQVATVVAGLESRASPAAAPPLSQGLDPVPPNPG